MSSTTCLESQLTASLAHISEARACGVSPQNAARAMRSQRRNASAAAEALFATILPPPPAQPALMPSVKAYEPSSREWRSIEQTAVETVRPGRVAR